jgi:hypothetical protein
MQQLTPLQTPIKTRHRRNSSVASAATHDSDILQQLNYNISSLPHESARWINVVAGQIIAAYRNLVLSSSIEEGGAKGFVERAVNARLGDDENPAYVCLVGLEAALMLFNLMSLCRTTWMSKKSTLGVAILFAQISE